MTSEAQKRATAKYQKQNVKTMTVKFYPGHMPMYEHLCKQDNKNAYIIGLIAADMAKGLPDFEYFADDQTWRNGRGEWMAYGEFGRDTYGLHVELDGREVSFEIDAHDGKDARAEANKFLAKLATGWRPLGF